jgi:hypothetical protein
MSAIKLSGSINSEFLSAIKLSGCINNELLLTSVLDDNGAHEDIKTTANANKSLILNRFI